MNKLFIFIPSSSARFTYSSTCCNLALSTYNLLKLFLFRLSIIPLQSNGHYSVLTLFGLFGALTLPPLCDARVPRLPWHYSGFLPTLPVPSQTLLWCILVPLLLEFLRVLSKIVFSFYSTYFSMDDFMPYFQISSADLFLDIQIYKSIWHIYFDIPQVAKFKMCRI